MFNQEYQKEWRSKTLAYATAVNTFIDKGLRDGWDVAGEEPLEPGRDHLVPALLDAIRLANENGDFNKLREHWPPAHGPLLSHLEENGQSLPIAYFLPDDSIVVRIGSHFEKGRTVQIMGDVVHELADVGFFGRGPNRRFFAIAQEDGVKVVDGWDGPEVAFCPWPTGLEGIPQEVEVKPLNTPPKPTQLIPFPDGQRVLLVSSKGIFVLTSSFAHRLLPTEDELTKDFALLQEKYPQNELTIELFMEHGAISKDGQYIAIGAQDTTHQIFNEHLSLIYNIDPQSEYPHYALFGPDDNMIAFNSCHLYNGSTIGVPISLLSASKTEADLYDELILELDDEARVYTGISHGDEFMVGDAYGYVRAFSFDGIPRWQHFIGSTVDSLDISQDGTKLVSGTCAGFLSIIKLNADKQNSYQIGNSQHLENRRWLFWKNETKPLIW